jgi:TonB-linked SusC/RagA family outer membrane protein
MKSNFLKKNRLLLLMVIIFILPAIGWAQTRSITGKVTDESGSELPGVTIRVSGTTIGVVTDLDGKYSIKAGSNDVLIFSFVGLATQEIKVGTSTSINVTLKPDVANLDEVVVVGYGVQAKESVVGAISQVSGEKLQTMKMGGSLENTLQGSLPGLTIIQTDATPGEEALSGLKMLIRGSSSLTNNSPLIIVDGIERGFSNIDANEVASITILKDASATAVYGVKGANGVLIVTTKRGKEGAVQLEISSQVSLKMATRLPEYLNSYQTLQMRNEGFRNDQLWDNIYSDEYLNHFLNHDSPILYPDVDWMDILFEPAIDHSYNMNVRGGNHFVQYFVSLGYLHEGDIMAVGDLFDYGYDKYNGHYFHDRYNFRNNLDFNLTKSTKLSVNLGGNIKKWGKPIDWYTQETWFEPVTLLPYYPAGTLDEFPDNVIPYDREGVRWSCNPSMGNVRLDWLGGRGIERKKSNELNVDVILDQKLDFITKGLSASGTFSYNNYARFQELNWVGPNYWGTMFGYYLNPLDSSWTRYTGDGKLDMDTPQPKLQIGEETLNEASRSIYYKAQLDYSHSFGSHNVSALGVFSRRESRAISDFPHYEENWVGRATYNFKEKYFLEGSLAYTGSEKFAPGLRFGLFPSMATGWKISDEAFFKKAIPWANLFKIKYSWGLVGSDYGIDRWLYISEYTNAGGATFGYPFTYYPGIAEGKIPITNATWETASKQNLGLEMGFWDNLLTVNLDFFDENRSNILQVRRSVPTWLGQSTISGNYGKTKAHGFELEVGVNKTFANDLQLFFTGHLSGQESRVVEYDEPAKKPQNLNVEGMPVEIASDLEYSSGVEVGGLYQNLDELFMTAKASGVNPGLGDQYYLDYNGDGTVDDQDKVCPVNPNAPMFTWNAKVGFNYKNWNGQLDFYGISDVDYQIRNGGEFYLFPFSQNKDNALVAHADYWTPSNTDANYPAVHANVETYNPNYRMSSFSNVEGAYFRLKNVRIGYSLKLDAFEKVGISNVELALTGTNLITFTNYPLGGDPEGQNSGVDFGAYPQLKRYTFELRIVF